ncbi:MAG: TfoX/Sxy family protein [Pseudomonadota bacterium]
MLTNSQFAQYILELLEPTQGISLKRMFGGYAVYKFGLPITLVIEDEIYFKVDDSNRADYEAINSEPFTYKKKDKTIIISNWKVPIEILEDQERLLRFVEKSYQVAAKSANKNLLWTKTAINLKLAAVLAKLGFEEKFKQQLYSSEKSNQQRKITTGSRHQRSLWRRNCWL